MTYGASIDIFGSTFYISADGDLNGPPVFYVPDPDDLDALTFNNVDGTGLAGDKAATGNFWTANQHATFSATKIS